ncbi:MAG: bifunctional class I SAM-dependent methyltransferase/DEAD/DEAH box helicase [Methylorubrum rhodinum]|uniref:strawberry notch-like NTP hydrolase domain-containing protein n=1 Tax=Methylorubrum rhodinum TaxID=29428 RepID=UPI003BAFB67B
MNLPVLVRDLDTALPSTGATATCLVSAGTALSEQLAKGRAIDASSLRLVMESACGGSDAEGRWIWKDAHEAGEIAQVLFLRRFWPAIRAKAGTSAARVAMLARLASLLPTQTRRSEESQALQQFSTPLPLGYMAARAAAITPADTVLEPSAGTGLLAIHAELAGARLILNEFAVTRAGILRALFSEAPLTTFDAEQIHDRLDPALIPSVVLMNPPFSASPRIEGRHAAATANHLRSAFARLAPGGRLVALTAESFAPERSNARDAFTRLVDRGARIVFSAGIPGAAYARHGTTIDTRLTVIDRAPPGEPGGLVQAQGVLPDLAALLASLETDLPERLNPVLPEPATVAASRALPGFSRRLAPAAAARPAPRPMAIEATGEEIAYTAIESLPETLHAPAALYEPYALQTLTIAGAKAHPTRLVQSAAMASVRLPAPTYRPCLPPRLVVDGLLSDAQLETVIYAGAAHARHLPGWWSVNDTADTLAAAAESTIGAVRFRQGFFLGDGTGAGKGRQVAGIILDNWLRGRRKALWISKSDTLIEDARRDWRHLGQEPLQIVPLSRFAPTKPIMLTEGILFTTYATLRSAGRGSRLDQIVAWLGAGFDGVIAFDESHALANAAGTKGARGDTQASQQGRAGLALQYRLAEARLLYVSATGAVSVHNLAYAHRLGLWGGGAFPFPARTDFVGAMEAGGLAAMEVLARDLKALGLYTARALSYEGVTVEMLDHALSEEQVAIYDAYADAFQVIHTNLTAALEATGITERGATLNRNAKSAARSAFESNKQRFFNHLLCAMKCPSLIRAIEAAIEQGHAAVVQIVSTSEALMERRITEIPASEWGDLQIDVTPREYVMDYLAHSFPTQLFEPYTDENGMLLSRPVLDEDGNPVQCREALARRDEMIEQLCALAPVQAALDQLIHHFGTDKVAEVTGRSRRIVRRRGEHGGTRLALENRPASSNLAETQSFQDDDKRILIFSDAGGTGRSYHADLAAKNQRLRVHFLLEAGWKADNAVQGLGRTNRTNQAQPPLFRPITSDVKGEKRFLSTIARRLDTLGAITRGERQTGGQGLFRPQDNLEGAYAAIALRQLFMAIHRGGIEGCSRDTFQAMTGLSIVGSDGALNDELPGVPRFLNRCLALRIAMQNLLFEAFEERLAAIIEGAIASGTYDVGLEVLTADSFRVTSREVAYTHPGTGAQTFLLTIAEKRRPTPFVLTDALAWLDQPKVSAVVNSKSGRAALVAPATSLTDEDGIVVERVRLNRPNQTLTIAQDNFAQSQWPAASHDAFATAWQAEIDALPEFEERDLHIVTGLLLPIWDRLPGQGMRVYRLVTDEGERIVGRRIDAEKLATTRTLLDLGAGARLSPADAWIAVHERGQVLMLTGGLELRRARVSGLNRVELIGFSSNARAQLRAMGLTIEVIAWKTRAFVPVGEDGLAILTTLFERHPVLSAPEAA